MTDQSNISSGALTSTNTVTFGSSKKGGRSSSSAGKSKKPKAKSNHPKYAAMIKQAITSLKDRNGSSKMALLKFIVTNYKIDPILANQHLKVALRAGVKNKTLKQTKGTGASGSFRLGTEAAAATKKRKIFKNCWW